MRRGLETGASEFEKPRDPGNCGEAMSRCKPEKASHNGELSRKQRGPQYYRMWRSQRSGSPKAPRGVSDSRVTGQEGSSPGRRWLKDSRGGQGSGRACPLQGFKPRGERWTCDSSEKEARGRKERIMQTEVRLPSRDCQMSGVGGGLLDGTSP